MTAVWVYVEIVAKPTSGRGHIINLPVRILFWLELISLAACQQVTGWQDSCGLVIQKGWPVVHFSAPAQNANFMVRRYRVPIVMGNGKKFEIKNIPKVVEFLSDYHKSCTRSSAVIWLLESFGNLYMANHNFHSDWKENLTLFSYIWWIRADDLLCLPSWHHGK